MVCIIFVRAIFHLDNPCHHQMSPLFCFRCVQIETWVSERYKNHEQAHLAIVHNVCYSFVYSLHRLYTKEQYVWQRL